MVKEPAIRAPVSVQWSRDISVIPKGKFVEKKVITKDEAKTVKTWSRDEVWIVITGNFDGQRQTIVNPSYWIPDENRWCGMIEGQDEIHAWAHHTGMGKDQRKPLLPDWMVA